MMSVLLTIFIALTLPIVLFYYFYRPNISTLKVVLGLVVNIMFKSQGKLPSGWSLDERDHVHLSKDLKDVLSTHNNEWK